MDIVPLSVEDMNGYSVNKYGDMFKGCHEIINGNINTNISKTNQPSIYFFLLLKNGKNMGHWTALFTKDNKALYYDPMGILSFPIKNINIFEDFRYNDKVIQKVGDTLCGLYCLREGNLFFHQPEQYLAS